ncbi:hypothetical protein B0H13DRAFT_2333324 [Mycena leptocephala]|nr:hypothetical protein B0H13DRAFT_2333324 [Mycena leptocephala]
MSSSSASSSVASFTASSSASTTSLAQGLRRGIRDSAISIRSRWKRAERFLKKSRSKATKPTNTANSVQPMSQKNYESAFGALSSQFGFSGVAPQASKNPSV